MALLRLNEFDPHHRRTVKGKDIRQFQVYSDQHQPIGQVVDALLDDTGQFHYLIADLRSPVSTRSALIALRQAQVDLPAERVYLTGLSQTQIAELPTYNMSDVQAVDSHVSETVSMNATPSAVDRSMLILEESASLESSLPLESVTPVEAQVVKLVQPITTAAVNSTAPIATPLSGASDGQPTAQSSQPLEAMTVPKGATPSTAQALHHVSSEVVDEKTIRLLEERLFVDRHKRKIGEVIVRKEIATQIVEIPIRREMLIVEQINPERKQLASIDLSDGILDETQLAQLGGSWRSPSSTTVNSAPSLPSLPENHATGVSREFSSIEAAIEFLRAIATQPDANSHQVQIRLTTPNH